MWSSTLDILASSGSLLRAVAAAAPDVLQLSWRPKALLKPSLIEADLPTHSFNRPEPSVRGMPQAVYNSCTPLMCPQELGCLLVVAVGFHTAGHLPAHEVYS